MAEVKVTKLEQYKDDRGNEISYDGSKDPVVDITIKGSNNRLVVAADANLAGLKVLFAGDNGVVEIGSTTKRRAPMKFHLKVGHDSAIRIGPNVGTDGQAYASAAEGAEVIVGADTMFAAGVELRSDDTHAIYDVRTGLRANPARTIRIGEHVWLA